MFRYSSPLAALVVAGSALAEAPLTQNFSDSNSCYGRHYSETHMRKHPQQQVVDIRLNHFPGDQQFLGLGGDYHSYPETPVLSLMLSVQLRSQNLGYAQVYCTQDGDRLHCGLECDAGHFYVVDRNPDSIIVKPGSDLYFSDCGEAERVLHREPDDKVFLLHRLPDAACHP